LIEGLSRRNIGLGPGAIAFLCFATPRPYSELASFGLKSAIAKSHWPDRANQVVVLLGDVDPAESESRCNGIIHALFAMQNHVNPTAIEAMAFCKRGLTSLTRNGGAQQVNNVIFFKPLVPLRRIIVVGHGAPPRYGPAIELDRSTLMRQSGRLLFQHGSLFQQSIDH
jgi:hypothetical protein